MPNLYAYQDGPDFYIFDRNDHAEDPEPAEVVHAPFAYKDGDLREAESARAWFRDQRPDVDVE